MDAANAADDKLPMFVIENQQGLDVFSGVRNFPRRYRAQKKSWMDSVLFEEWIREFDCTFERETRKVAFIVDKCPPPPHTPSCKGLKSVNLVFVSPSTTSKTQPMDQGVMRALKAHYRSKVVQMYISVVDSNKPLPQINILVAMDMLVRVQDNVSTSTIQNCFRAAGISQQSQECTLTDHDNPFKMLAEEVGNLRERTLEHPPGNVTADIVVEYDNDAATFDVAPLTNEEILGKVRQSKSSDIGEEGKEMDEESVEIADEPLKPPSQYKLLQEVDVLNTFSFFTDDKHVNDLHRSTRIISDIVEKSFWVEKKQELITRYFC